MNEKEKKKRKKIPSHDTWLEFGIHVEFLSSILLQTVSHLKGNEKIQFLSDILDTLVNCDSGCL